MKTFYIVIILFGLSIFPNTITAQVIDPDTGQVMKSKTNLDSIPTKAEKNREKTMDKLAKTNSRHKPFRIRTAIRNKKYADIDLSSVGIENSFTLGLDIPTFTLYKELYIGISGIANFNILNSDLQEETGFKSLIVYGVNANINYSFKIIDGLYIVPLVGYGYVGITEQQLDTEEPTVDPNDPTIPSVDDTYDLNLKDSSTTYLNYGAFLDFSFLLSATGFGITAGYTYYSGFTFGIQF